MFDCCSKVDVEVLYVTNLCHMLIIYLHVCMAIFFSPHLCCYVNMILKHLEYGLNAT